MGGNDARFGDVVKTCVGTRLQCQIIAGPWLAGLDASLDGQKPPAPKDDGKIYVNDSLRDLYRAVRAKAPGALIYTTTYPDPLPARECPALGLDAGETSFIRDVFMPRLNGDIHFTAMSLGIGVIDVEPHLRSGGLCANGPDSHGPLVNGWRWQRPSGAGLLPGSPDMYVTGTLHPTAAGHKVVADVVESRLRQDLADPPRDTSPPPDLPPSGPIAGPPEGGPPDQPPAIEPIGAPPAIGATDLPPTSPPAGAPPSPPGQRAARGGALPRDGEPGFWDAPALTGAPARPSPDIPPPTAGEIVGPPLGPWTLRENPCARVAVTHPIRPRTKGPLVILDASPATPVCSAEFLAPWSSRTADASGVVRIPESDITLDGVGGLREAVYRNKAGDVVWLQELPGPSTAESPIAWWRAWKSLYGTALTLGAAALLVASLIVLALLKVAGRRQRLRPAAQR